MHRHPAPRHPVIVTAVSALLAVMSTTQAVAEDRFYVGMDAMNWFYDEDGGEDFSSLGVRGRLGLQLTPQFSLETHLGASGTDRSSGERRELDWLYAVLARGDLPITRYTSLYGVMGIAGVEISGRDAAGDSFSESDSGVSIGLGLDFQVADGAHLNLDYIRYLDASDFDFSALSVGARWTF